MCAPCAMSQGMSHSPYIVCVPRWRCGSVRKSVVVDQAAADDQPEWPRPQVLRDKVKWISSLTSACFALMCADRSASPWVRLQQ